MSSHKRFISLTSIFAFVFGVGFPASRAEADPMREFVLSCAYGTLAGTLVGVASLAFSDRPGDNLNRVARGASIGLYGGILLGAYIVNSAPGENEDDVPPGVTFNNDPGVPVHAPGVRQAKIADVKNIGAAKTVAQPLSLQIYPLITERGFEGGAARLSLLSF